FPGPARCSLRSRKYDGASTEMTGIPRWLQRSTNRAPTNPAAPVTRRGSFDIGPAYPNLLGSAPGDPYLCRDVERAEIRIRVVIVFAFCLFEEGDKTVRDRRHDDFPSDLQEIIPDHDFHDEGSFPDSKKRDGIEDERTDDFPPDRRTDRALPKVFSRSEE